MFGACAGRGGVSGICSSATGSLRTARFPSRRETPLGVCGHLFGRLLEELLLMFCIVRLRMLDLLAA